MSLDKQTYFWGGSNLVLGDGTVMIFLSETNPMKLLQRAISSLLLAKIDSNISKKGGVTSEGIPQS